MPWSKSLELINFIKCTYSGVMSFSLSGFFFFLFLKARSCGLSEVGSKHRTTRRRAKSRIFTWGGRLAKCIAKGAGEAVRVSLLLPEGVPGAFSWFEYVGMGCISTEMTQVFRLDDTTQPFLWIRGLKNMGFLFLGGKACEAVPGNMGYD
jgi:hypothetical protein